MQNNLSNPSPLQLALQFISVLMVLFGFVILGSVVFSQVLQLLLGKSFGSTDALFQVVKANPNGQIYLLLAQMCTALVSFIVLPFLYLNYAQQDLLRKCVDSLNRVPPLVGWVLLIGLLSFPLIGFLAQLNKDLLQLPAQFEHVTQWMLRSELAAKQLTELIVFTDSPLEFLLALLVIAILPAVGEEFLFRGILQNKFFDIFKNPHVAIWSAAFLFSFIHFQFFGFIPRFFLGLVFGYVYYWTRNLWLPILLHFINNFATLVIVNWQRNHGVANPLDDEMRLPLLPVFMISIGFAYMLWTLKTKASLTVQDLT